MQFTSADLAAYARTVANSELPPPVREQAGRLCWDSLGCCLGARDAAPVAALRACYENHGSADEATILGTDTRIPVEYAALINGAMVRYLDYNDCYISGSSVCHPSDHIPGLLAVAEAEGRSGAALVRAIVIAYEIQAAGIDTGAIWDRGFDYVTWGSYSAAAAVGTLMGLSEQELVNAIGIAGTANNGLLISRLGAVSQWKGVAMPYAIHGAIQACQMARGGLTGPSAVIEGEAGFEATVAGQELSVEEWGGQDGAPYRIMRTNFKPYACGYFMQAPIAAVLELVDRHDIEPARIEAIEIEEFEQAVQVLASPEKFDTNLNRETADHSIPYSVAVGVLDGTVTPRQYASDRLADPAVHALMETVSVTEAPDITARRAANPGLIPARATVSTGAGRFSTTIDYPTGHWQSPMSEEALTKKVTDLVGDTLGADSLAELEAWCGAAADHPHVDGLISTLAGRGA